jgi:hypothetical protein
MIHRDQNVVVSMLYDRIKLCRDTFKMSLPVYSIVKNTLLIFRRNSKLIRKKIEKVFYTLIHSLVGIFSFDAPLQHYL